MPIVDRIQEKLGIDLAIFEMFDETQIQEQLADVLRKKALDHLLRSPEPMAKDFRVTFLKEHPGRSMRDYFTTMGKSGQWGTEDEVKAVAEMLDFNLNVNFIEYEFNQEGTDVIERSAMLEQYKTSTPDAPTITLNNRESQHWFVNDATVNDGNCLFGAIAQSLQQLVRLELTRDHTNTSPVSDVTDSESIDSLDRVKNVDNSQLEVLKTKIGSEVINTLIDNMQQTSLSEFEAVKLISEDLIKAMGTEMPNIEDKYKDLLQTAESISDMNTIIDDMRIMLKKQSLLMLDILVEDGIMEKGADQKMSKQLILKVTSLAKADELLGALIKSHNAHHPSQDTPRDNDVTPSSGFN